MTLTPRLHHPRSLLLLLLPFLVLPAYHLLLRLCLDDVYFVYCYPPRAETFNARQRHFTEAHQGVDFHLPEEELGICESSYNALQEKIICLATPALPASLNPSTSLSNPSPPSLPLVRARSAAAIVRNALRRRRVAEDRQLTLPRVPLRGEDLFTVNPPLLRQEAAASRLPVPASSAASPAASSATPEVHPALTSALSPAPASASPPSPPVPVPALLPAQAPHHAVVSPGVVSPVLVAPALAQPFPGPAPSPPSSSGSPPPESPAAPASRPEAWEVFLRYLGDLVASVSTAPVQPGDGRPAPRADRTAGGSRAPDQQRPAACRPNARDSARIQRLYRRTPRWAIREILQAASPYCAIPERDSVSHLVQSYTPKEGCTGTPPSNSVLNPAATAPPLLDLASPLEVAALLRRTSNIPAFGSSRPTLLSLPHCALPGLPPTNCGSSRTSMRAA
ncbi:hypothetical protein J6590_087978 [Homalodisca vitripennis]|nr:hypothetical protein J6590_087978 [Homalodisca vitripennis]